jgi:hypothetical protein
MSYDSDISAQRTKYGARNIEEMGAEFSDGSAENLTEGRSLLDSAYATLQYIGSLPRQQFRKSDKVSDLLVLVCLLFAVMLITLPPQLLKPPVVTLADFVFLAVIVFFILSRLGILVTLTQRQAVLVWDIVIGTFLLGILLCFNAMYFIASMHH